MPNFSRRVLPSEPFSVRMAVKRCRGSTSLAPLSWAISIDARRIFRAFRLNFSKKNDVFLEFSAFFMKVLIRLIVFFSTRFVNLRFFLACFVRFRT